MTTDGILRETRSGRFTARLAFYDEPMIAEQLERAAEERGVSAATVLRSAVRGWLLAFDPEQDER
jgi:hypothetical protein